MMSVFTLFLLLAICFTSIVVSAPNERANRLLKPIQAKFQSDVSVQSVSRSKSASDESSTASPIATSIYGSSVDIPTSWSALLPFASPTATGPTSINSSTSNPNNAGNSNGTPATSIALSYSGPGVSPMSSSISNLGAASVSSGLQPYPSQGAPYQNVSSPIGEPAGYNSSDTVGSGSNCSSVQTVTLPPVTVTLPAITVTMTASPETTTSTITTTITAGPVAACTSAMGSLFAGQGVAQTNLPNTFGLNATAAGSAAQSGSVGSGFPGQGATQSNIPSAPGLNATSAGSAAQSGSAGSAEPSQDVTQPGTSDIPGSNASAAGSVPPVSTGLNTQGAETEANELPSQTPGGGSATTSTPPSYFSIPASLASQLDRIPLYSLTPAGSPIVPAYSYAQSSSSAAAAQMNSGPPPSITPTGGSPLQTTPFVSPPYVAPYQNATGAGGVAAPSGAGTISGVVPAASGSPGPTGGPTAPPHQSLLLYQINGSFVPEPTAKASPPAGVNYTNTAPSINLGPVQPFTGAPAGPTLPPIPSLNDSNPQAPPLSPFSTNSQCSINNTSTQNLTTNYDSLQPSNSTAPLINLGLNYTTFTLSTTPSPNHLVASQASTPKTIAVASPFLSFNLYSFTLSCISDPAPSGNCSIEIFALQSSGPGAPQKASFLSHNVSGSAPQTISLEGGMLYDGVSEVTLTASSGGVSAGIGIWSMDYGITSSC